MFGKYDDKRHFIEDTIYIAGAIFIGHWNDGRGYQYGSLN